MFFILVPQAFLIFKTKLLKCFFYDNFIHVYILHFDYSLSHSLLTLSHPPAPKSLSDIHDSFSIYGWMWHVKRDRGLYTWLLQGPPPQLLLMAVREPSAGRPSGWSKAARNPDFVVRWHFLQILTRDNTEKAWHRRPDYLRPHSGTGLSQVKWIQSRTATFG